MKTVSKIAMSLFALAMTMALAPAAFAAETGKVKVTVLGTDGKAAPAGLAVRITAPGGGAGGKPKAAAPAASKALAADEKPKGAGGAGGRGGPAIKEGVTGTDGTVTLDEVPVGTYRVSVRGKEGQGQAPVTVEAGKTAEVSITLKAAPAKGEKPAK